MKPAFRRLLLAAIGFVIIEALAFRTDWYSAWLEPESTSGNTELVLGNELRRYTPGDKNQVLAIGDSRMGLFPRVANGLAPPTGYTFASISNPGSTMRDWYYMLREVDPGANRYAAVILGVNDYDDDETQEDWDNRSADLNYLLPVLRLTDVWEFSQSYHSPDRRMATLEGALFKGIVYKRDFQAFLLNTKRRVTNVEYYKNNSAGWYYGYAGEQQSLAGLTIDWSVNDWRTQGVTWPPGLPVTVKKVSADVFSRPDLPMSPDFPRNGQQAAYRREWLGKIVDRYRSSSTRLIFLRLPRGPLVNPAAARQYNPAGVIRGFATRPDVILLPEHTFDGLEHPELFQDPYHMNAAGCDRFSEKAAREVARVLHPLQALNR